VKVITGQMSGVSGETRTKPVREKIVIWLLAVFLLTTVSFAEAQQSAKLAKIGFLGAGGLGGAGSGSELFKRELRALGYVEGKNIAINYRSTEGKRDRLPALADDLVRLKVDVLVTSSTIAALAAKNATRTIPIIFYTVTDPVAAGLVDSLTRPGGNITGITDIGAVFVWQTAGVTQGNHSQALPRSSAVGSTESWQCATMERKPTAGTRTGLAASFHGGKQPRQIRGHVQGGN
jgi:ABC transporter substrate binding protein